MIEPYAWTTDPDQEPNGAIVVNLKGDGAFSSLGDSFVGTVLAFIFWCDKARGYDSARTILEGPYSVPKALKQASMLCQQGKYDRGVISIEDRSLWLPEWGVLRTIEGLD